MVVDFLEPLERFEGAPLVQRTPSGRQVVSGQEGDEEGPDLSSLIDQEAEPPADKADSPRELSSHPEVEDKTGQPSVGPMVRCFTGAPIGRRSPGAPKERQILLNGIRGKPLMQTSHESFMHGRGYDGPKLAPNVLWASDRKPRKDHDAPMWLTATEYEDDGQVMRAKISYLARLMRASKHTTVYSGAGISASAVGQAALSGVNKVGWKNKTEAQPTLTHYALAVLGRSGWVDGWVQQNHDGLPQKAGFPQEAICEVHGSWYDPSNPVVKYSGSLKEAECAWMERETEHADLVLVMGTSLGGLYADQVATEAAGRASAGNSLGAAIINLQQTTEDDKMTLKISGKSDDVLLGLLAELGLPPLPAVPQPIRAPAQDCVLVPYDKHGLRLPDGSDAPRMWLDLRCGALVQLSKHHNCQGAKQPLFIHIGSKKGQKFHGKPIANAGAVGCGTCMGRDELTASFKLSIESAFMRLGIWWLEAAQRGGPTMLPVVNQAPAFEDSPAPAEPKAAAAAPRKSSPKVRTTNAAPVKTCKQGAPARVATGPPRK